MSDDKDIEEMNLVKGAPLLAARNARMHGTDLVVKRNGKITFESPEEFEKYLQQQLK